MFAEGNVFKESEILRSQNYFWDGVEEESPENVLDRAIWEIGILNTPKKYCTEWATQVDTNHFFICFKSDRGEPTAEPDVQTYVIIYPRRRTLFVIK